MGPHPVVLFLVFNVKLPAGLLSFHKGPSGTYLGRQFGDIGPICCFTVESQRWRNLGFFPLLKQQTVVSQVFQISSFSLEVSSRHGPLFVLKHGDMVTTGAPGTRAPTQVNLPPVAAQWADREDRRRCSENFRMPIAEKVDTSDFYSDIALDFYEKWYFLTIY
jgi:hypothetical protein